MLIRGELSRIGALEIEVPADSTAEYIDKKFRQLIEYQPGDDYNWWVANTIAAKKEYSAIKNPNPNALFNLKK